MLSDGTIRRLVEEGRIVDRPVGSRRWSSRRSVDLRLGDSFRVFHNHRARRSTCASRRRTSPSRSRSPRTSRSSSIPASSCLGRTEEQVELPDDVVARIEGKSLLGRLGLIVHATAGFVDPGFTGTLTLEITNLTRVPIKL